jgi:hypothetical protein
LTPAGVRGWGDPTGALASWRLPGTPAESKCPERKSTVKFNRALFLSKTTMTKVAIFRCYITNNQKNMCFKFTFYLKHINM